MGMSLLDGTLATTDPVPVPSNSAKPDAQAVATRAAPELILLACEVKVAARRAGHLLRTYGCNSFCGSPVAWMRRSRVVSEYGKVTERLRGLMPGAPSGTAVPGRLAPTSAGDASLASPFGMAGTGFGSSGGGNSSSADPRSLLERVVGSSGGSGSTDGGHVLRQGRNERVYAVSFMPPELAAATGGGLCVWWALDSAVEFYSDATQSTTSFAIEGDVHLTCVAIDDAGNTWGGSSCGTLLVRRPRVWDVQAEERLFGGPVHAIAFDTAAATVWAGDEHGCVRAARLNEDSWRIEPLFTALEGRAPAPRRLSGSVLLRASNNR